jgi:signal transduction histidine kinase/FixJ family two-component response regulator
MSTPHVLIVDDDPTLLQAFPKLMRLWMDWVTVDTANSAPVALDRVAATDYDAIISDIRMPGMSGLELLAAIRARRPTTPILLITAYSEREFVMQALRAGAYDFIQKPLDSEYFVASLSRAIQMRHLSRQIEAQQDALTRHAAELETTVAERTRDLRAALVAQDALLAERDQALVQAEAAKKRLLFLAEASNLLATSLDYDTTLALVTRLAVPYLADYCSLDMVEDDGSLRYVTTTHMDPAKTDLVAEFRRQFPPVDNPAYPVRDVLRSGQPLLYADIIGDMTAAGRHNIQLHRLLQALDPRSCMVVPLAARDRTLGLLTFVGTTARAPYSADDLTLAEDIARRAALAVDNARLYQEAQKALRVRDHFLSIASHELKTPMTSVLASAQVLQRRAALEGRTDPRDARTLRILIQQTLRLHRLVVSLLDLSRIDTGQLSIERHLVDLNGLLDRLLDEMSPAFERHTLLARLGEAPVLVLGDELRLEQVLYNLLQNAVKYSPNGGTIGVRLDCAADEVAVTVTDEGIGIPADALAQLFDRFYRAEDPATQRISGMGVGLYVVKEIVTLHGGTVAAAGREGQGSTFTVRLPLYQAPLPAE